MFSPTFFTFRRSVKAALLAGAILCGSSAAFAQSQSTQEKQDKNDPDLLEQRKAAPKNNVKKRDETLNKEIKKWVNQDVRWIITDDEIAALKQLSNQEEFDNFVEQFWLRRDPTPDTPENEFREEHYRRIAYANEHFAAGKAGSLTDRGQIYIKFGPADEVDSHPSGGTYDRPIEEGGGTTSTFPFEDWRYRYIEGIGQEVIIEFVDTCMCGDYHMTLDRGEKDALAKTPNGGLTQYEEMGLATKADRFGSGLETLGKGPMSSMDQSKQFDRLEQFAKLQAAPPVKFKDLDEIVTTHVRYNLMPFDVHYDFVRVTGDTVLVPVTLQMKNRDITFTEKDGIQRGLVNIYGRVTSLTGRIAQTFEDTVRVDVPKDLLQKTVDNSNVYWKAMPLRPGRYKVDIVVKDVNGERVGTWERSIIVPNMGDEAGLTTSTLILADQMERVPAKSIGTGNFVLGSTKVRPRVESADGKPATFKRDQKMNFWMQVYNLGIDDKTKKADASFQYEIVDAKTNKPVVQTSETTAQLGSTGEEVTLEKSLPLGGLQPGTYTLNVKVNDNVSKQQLVRPAKFVVE
ncbi:MAG: GWxTD domain-containing protein [Acidobacteriales bacterium]|nr:GWxTD domain-containing protein [Terriglobales bacterium]